MTTGLKKFMETTLERPFSQIVDLNMKMWQGAGERKKEEEESMRLFDRLHRWMEKTFETPFLQGDMAEVENWRYEEKTENTAREDLEPVCFYM